MGDSASHRNEQRPLLRLPATQTRETQPETRWSLVFNSAGKQRFVLLFTKAESRSWGSMMRFKSLMRSFCLAERVMFKVFSKIVIIIFINYMLIIILQMLMIYRVPPIPV